MRTVQDTINDMERELIDWVGWGHRLEAFVEANPVECRCWDNNGRNGTQGHIGQCAEWRALAASIKTKSSNVAGPSMEPAPDEGARGEEFIVGAGGFAAQALRESYDAGNPIEIPSLGITLRKSDDPPADARPADADGDRGGLG